MALRITLPDADLSAELLERYSVQQKIGEGAYSSVRSERGKGGHESQATQRASK